MDLTDTEFDAANRRGAEMRARFPAALAVRYDRTAECLVISLSSGQQITVAPQELRGLESARPEQLGDAQISPSGLGIHFPQLDADIYLPDLLSTANRSRPA
ncbi:DUF2442 domain-containing protein [Duganella callida]|uniref:DUF2442 domain-containing protein n=1 Tax=Duganella callida TaxID=2561932 RepID=A0A4Y9RZV4_9BURK|nr:DUF2442 domain-containing protein [Duganella callida]TFW13275.1 DUF2442 domain-containing protein [Duganella callida]